MTDDLRPAFDAATEAAAKLIEHCDGVIILMSATDGCGHTQFVRMLRGNSHAVEGAVREYIRRVEGYEHGYHAERGRMDAEEHLTASLPEEPIEGDEWKQD